MLYDGHRASGLQDKNVLEVPGPRRTGFGPHSSAALQGWIPNGFPVTLDPVRINGRAEKDLLKTWEAESCEKLALWF